MTAAPPTAPLHLRVRHLDLRHGLGWPRGADLSFDVHAGEVLTVLGGNGSGKSLLVKYLTGIFRAGPGCIRFRADPPPSEISADPNGSWLDLARRDDRERARATLGVVFQRPALVRTLTVAQNVALALRDHSARQRREVPLLLRLIGVGHTADAYPHELSAGEAQCAAVARALAGGRRLLLCDEPHAALGPATTHRLSELLRTLVHTGVLTAAVICTQDLRSALRLGHRFLLLGTGPRFGFGQVHASADALRADPEFAQLAEPPVAPLAYDDPPFFPPVHRESLP